MNKRVTDRPHVDPQPTGRGVAAWQDAKSRPGARENAVHRVEVGQRAWRADS